MREKDPTKARAAGRELGPPASSRRVQRAEPEPPAEAVRPEAPPRRRGGPVG